MGVERDKVEAGVPMEGGRPRVPIGQVIFDEVFLWIFLSLVISLVFYNAWGLLDLVRNPVVN